MRKLSEFVERNKLKFPILVTIVILLLGPLYLVQPIEDILRGSRIKFFQHEASGEIGIIGIDQQDTAEFGGYPIPRRYHAILLDKLNAAGAEFVGFDFTFVRSTADDQLFHDAIKRSKAQVVVATSAQDLSINVHRAWMNLGIDAKASRFTKLAPAFEGNVTIAATNNPSLVPDWKQVGYGGLQTPQGMVYQLHQHLGNAATGGNNEVYADLSTSVNDIPSVRYRDVIRGDISLSKFKVKRWIIGVRDDALGDNELMLGHGIIPGVDTIALYAEGHLKGGAKHYSAWIAVLLAGLIASLLLVWNKPKLIYWSPLLFFIAGFPLLALLESNNLIVDYFPGVIALVIIALHTWARRVREGAINAGTSVNPLSNLEGERALLSGGLKAGQVLCAMKFEGNVAPPDGYQLLATILKANLGVAEVFHLDRTTYAGWIDLAKLPKTGSGAAMAMEACRASAINLGGVEDVHFGICTAALDMPVMLEQVRASLERARSNGILFFSDVGDDGLFSDGWDKGDSAETTIKLKPVLDLHEGYVAGALLDLSHYREMGDEVRLWISASFERLNQVSERGKALSLWLVLSVDSAVDSKVIDQIVHARHEFDLDAGNVVIVVEGPDILDPGHMLMRSVSELRGRGFRFCLSGLGKKKWRFDALRSVRATDLRVNGSIFDEGQLTANNFIEAAVKLTGILDRRLIVDGIDTKERLATARWAKVDFVVGDAVGEVVGLDGLATLYGRKINAV